MENKTINDEFQSFSEEEQNYICEASAAILIDGSISHSCALFLEKVLYSDQYSEEQKKTVYALLGMSGGLR